MSETSGMSSPWPKRAWPRLETEMRNHFLSELPQPLPADAGSGEQRLPYSTRDLVAWQVEIVDRFPLLYRCEEVGREDYCHLRNGFSCGEQWAVVIRDLSEMAEALVRAVRSSAQPGARFTASEVSEKEGGMLRWRINTNLRQQFLGLITDYF
jgi:hypothetical protein